MVNQTGGKKREPIDPSASIEWTIHTVQSAVAISLVTTISILIGPALLDENSDLAQRIGNAALLGLTASIAMNPIVRYVRLLWREESAD